jgi:hypothetical protein
VFPVDRPQFEISVTELVDEPDDVIAMLTSDCIDVVILFGDVSSLDVDSMHAGVKFVDLFASLGMTQHVSSATHVTSLLDTVASIGRSVVTEVRAGQVMN